MINYYLVFNHKKFFDVIIAFFSYDIKKFIVKQMLQPRTTGQKPSKIGHVDKATAARFHICVLKSQMWSFTYVGKVEIAQNLCQKWTTKTGACLRGHGRLHSLPI